jgi:hypothetical protein
LHALAEDIEAHDKAHVEDRKRLIQRARQLFQHFGYGPQAIATNLRRGGEYELPHLDQVAEILYAEHPEQFAGHERDLYDRLTEMLTEGNPQPMSTERVYEQALEHLREHGIGGSEVSDKPLLEDEGEETFAFGANAREPAKPKIPLSPRHRSQIGAAWQRFNSGNQPSGSGGLFGASDMAGRTAFAKLPDDSPVLITQGQYAGHTARIVRDPVHQRIAAEIDGAPHLGLIPVDHTSIEPLSSAQSWRAETASAPSTQGSLLTAEHFLPRKSYLWCDPPAGHPWAWRRLKSIDQSKTASKDDLSEEDAEKILQALEAMCS